MRFGLFWQTPGYEGSSIARRHWEAVEEIALSEELGFESAWLAESVFYPTRPMSNPLMVAIAAAHAFGPESIAVVADGDRIYIAAIDTGRELYLIDYNVSSGVTNLRVLLPGVFLVGTPAIALTEGHVHVACNSLRWVGKRWQTPIHVIRTNRDGVLEGGDVTFSEALGYPALAASPSGRVLLCYSSRSGGLSVWQGADSIDFGWTWVRSHMDGAVDPSVRALHAVPVCIYTDGPECCATPPRGRFGRTILSRPVSFIERPRDPDMMADDAPTNAPESEETPAETPAEAAAPAKEEAAAKDVYHHEIKQGFVITKSDTLLCLPSG